MSRQQQDDDAIGSVENEYDEYDDDSQQPLITVNQPFYTYDDQNDEQYYIIDNDSYDQPNSVDTTNNID